MQWKKKVHLKGAKTVSGDEKISFCALRGCRSKVLANAQKFECCAILDSLVVI
jgi:hypothetical protein